MLKEYFVIVVYQSGNEFGDVSIYTNIDYEEKPSNEIIIDQIMKNKGDYAKIESRYRIIS